MDSHRTRAPAVAGGAGGVLSFWGIGYNQHLHGQNNVCRGANQQVIEMLDSIAPLDAAIAPL